MISKLVFLYDSTVKPFHGFDVRVVRRRLGGIQAAGIECELIDTKGMSQAEVGHWREKAVVVAVRYKQKVRPVFGSRRAGGLPYLGKQVPALFVFEKGRTDPVAVYPHEKAGKKYSIEAFLEQCHRNLRGRSGRRCDSL